MHEYKVAIIGGGPAGMMAAIKAAQELGPKTVCIIEKNDGLGKKLLMTGGGRCNIANSTPIHDQLNYYKKNKNFLKHALYTLPQEKLLAIFEEKDLEFHIEDKKRIFPDSEDAHDVLDVLEEYLEELEVDTYLSCPIDANDMEHELNERMEPVFLIENDKISLNASKIVVSTGGITYPSTGSTGDGYKIASKMNHNITDIKPGLVSFNVDDFLLRSLSGLTLNDVEISFKDKKKKTSVRGDLLISHFGLTGPAVIDLSNLLIEKSKFSIVDDDLNLIDDEEMENLELFSDRISIDFTPDLTEEDIKAQITKDTPESGTLKIKNYMKKFLPSNFIDYFLMKLDISPNKTMANITKKEKNKIAEDLKRHPIVIEFLEIDLAKVTIGGVKSKEIDSKTLQSRFVEGLYFAGEVLEVAGPTGGYNLQIAFATGYLAGQEAANSLK
ncbi:aminoacetone oxidase family FAD-binding enzyme [Methanobrevibacter sp.]|uniref:NAD(P)/FAD-dependent oxidoreductase n=1 Tax=Methanobrevibacter sp. TaxID=66852 RepID=UPI0025E3C48C|nr:aminoacetone oxidase family FAD-binding enzyme [Methanobrevibacter sp.]MBQ2962915.1 aminoacetone oxidase family FAD-binding enzyme [Methanobrevibacter sp.]